MEDRQYLDSAEIKKELMDMLVTFDSFLKEHDIPYTIMSGTLLGAVRHGGFIPWDDDLDLGLTRENYERLLAVLRKENRIGEKLYASGCELKNGSWPFLKIMNPDVQVQEIGDRIVIEGQKLWLDVFPFDFMPCHFQKPLLVLIRCFRKLKYLKLLYTDEFLKTVHPAKRFFLYIFRFFNSICSDTFYSRCIVWLSKRGNPRSNLIGDLSWGRAGWGKAGIDKCFDPALFEELVPYAFEGKEFPGFKDYDTYLKLIYRDYMKLPPEEKRVNHGMTAWWTKEEEK